MSLNQAITEYTRQLMRKGLLRTRVVSTPDSPDLIRFDSNDYLSLTQDKRIAGAYQDGYKRFPSGSGGSMLLSGYHETLRAVEQAFAGFLAVDECVLFPSGYAANLAIAALLGQLKATCLVDKGVHASIYDGLTQSQVPFQRYAHNDLGHLRSQFNACPSNTVLLTEGIFSMSGQQAPLAQINALCQEKSALLMVDEAHSFGVIGRAGRGAVDADQLTQTQVPLRMIALGKAFAGQGAIIAGQAHWIQALLQAGRSLIYSTAVSPALSYGLLKTLDVVEAAEDRRFKLMRLIDCFRACIKQSPLIWNNSYTAIQQLQLSCPHLTQRYAGALKKQGFLCSAVRQPTVTAKATGLRIILNARHEEDQIIQLFNQLSRFYASPPE